MFDQPGIGIEDIAWIQRDQFVYYVEMERALNDATDWPRFRDGLLQALQAAFGLNIDPRQVTDLLERLRSCHDPVTDWPAFFDALWDNRAEIRADL